MKKLITVLIVICVMNFTACTNSDDSVEADVKCGFDAENRQLYKGPQDGCYYINNNGNKTYVDRDECNC
ncbi:hypothetical protein C8N46_112124 [Kordia periserrulae]|uniref:PBCV-specific basic adaptor domain-containing protein n=1 Tax=Kordia periserrulae TaxID=701523 RepID=A0A2T6BRZ7_9FLAO|nr:hypothetical protein [Kordia periserrulae]PTX58816.1 hypothetical protein C8N46_112124 [Kordia periserrulae]